MSIRGTHFALSSGEAAGILEAAGDDDNLMELVDAIEERWDKEWLADSDKAWDPIHRCLTDGYLGTGAGTPLALCILGGQQLYQADDFAVSFVSQEDVPRVSAALESVEEAWMRERYFEIPEEDYGTAPAEDDFAYMWRWFQEVRNFYRKASAAGRAVIFVTG